MYLQQLKLWNFRKYGNKISSEIDLKTPNLVVDFKNGLNVLVGENDSGKTAIIDSIKYILGTESNEYIRFDDEDFYLSDLKDEKSRRNKLRIECLFKNLSDEEAAHFIEWLGIDDNNEYFLRVFLTAERQKTKISTEIKAGVDEEGYAFYGDVRNWLRSVYLKPLRDADRELNGGKHSRLSQILKNHSLFTKGNAENDLIEIVTASNNRIKSYFQGEGEDFEEMKLLIEVESIISSLGTTYPTVSEKITALLEKYKKDDGLKIKNDLEDFLNEFRHPNESKKSDISIMKNNLNDILNKLTLSLLTENAGLGSNNILFIAAELLLLQREDYSGLKLAIIEEIEAHLHPQAQLRLIDYLQHKDFQDKHGQIILTTHSSNITSKIKLENLIICKNNNAYPMGADFTKLDQGDYLFLERFLDVTKANLFFAKGVILVEGDAENILLPKLAEFIDKPLHKYGISIVNVGSTAFLRYANIFKRKDGKDMNLPVAIVTDLDIRAWEYYQDSQIENKKKPQIYLLENEEITTASGETHNVKEIVGEFFESKDSLKASIKNILGVSKMPVGLNAEIDKIEEKEITKDLIPSMREKKKNNLKSKSEGNIRFFVNNNWTLEYDLALSEILRQYLAQSILCAQKIKNSENFFTEMYKEDGQIIIPTDILTKERELCNSEEDEEIIGYNIFKPFVSNNKPSKAVTAQIFAELLKQNETTIKESIKVDEYIKYIFDAILFVTDNQEV